MGSKKTSRDIDRLGAKLFPKLFLMVTVQSLRMKRGYRREEPRNCRKRKNHGAPWYLIEIPAYAKASARYPLVLLTNIHRSLFNGMHPRVKPVVLYESGQMTVNKFQTEREVA